MTLEEFRDDVLTAMKNKPESLRDGQFVFNYISEKYSDIRLYHYISIVDCYYNDKNIDEFINTCFYCLTNKNNDNSDRSKTCSSTDKTIL